MKTNKLILCSVLAGLITATASTGYASPQPSASSAITWTAGGEQSKQLDVLFVQNAKNVTLEKGKLVLRGVNPVTVCFTDRPARLAGHMPTSKFVPLWSQGKDSFLKDNPNATLSVFHGDKVSDLASLLQRRFEPRCLRRRRKRGSAQKPSNALSAALTLPTKQ